MADVLIDNLRSRLNFDDTALLRMALDRIETLTQYQDLYYELLNASGPKLHYGESCIVRHRQIVEWLRAKHKVAA